MKSVKKTARPKPRKTSVKKKKSVGHAEKDEGSCWIAASLGDFLFDSFQKSIATRSGSKTEAIDQVFVNYARAWNKGQVDRRHLGSHEFEQKTFYIRKSTAKLMREIAAADGTPIAGVIRSALAWNVERELGPRDFLGKRPKIFRKD